MNVLATKHRSRLSVEKTKGSPLGRVGVFIILGFVGLILATTLIGVQAYTSNNMIEIGSYQNILSANLNEENLDEAAALEWSWFKVTDDTSAAFNNSDYFAEQCEDTDTAEQDTVISGKIVEKGQGSSLDLNDDSLYYLHCFKVAISSSEAGTNKAFHYGGYRVTTADLN